MFSSWNVRELIDRQYWVTFSKYNLINHFLFIFCVNMPDQGAFHLHRITYACNKWQVKDNKRAFSAIHHDIKSGTNIIRLDQTERTSSLMHQNICLKQVIICRARAFSSGHFRFFLSDFKGFPENELEEYFTVQLQISERVLVQMVCLSGFCAHILCCSLLLKSYLKWGKSFNFRNLLCN